MLDDSFVRAGVKGAPVAMGCCIQLLQVQLVDRCVTEDATIGGKLALNHQGSSYELRWLETESPYAERKSISLCGRCLAIDILGGVLGASCCDKDGSC